MHQYVYLQLNIITTFKNVFLNLFNTFADDGSCILKTIQ